MAAPTNMIHAHLPQVLFVRSDGSERKTAPAVSQMSEDEILTIEAIRDRLLDLYFPAAHKRSWQKANYGIGVPNRETIYTFTAGRNHDRKKPKPYLFVGDEFRTGKTAVGWESSLQMWMEHLKGNESIFANWTDQNQRRAILLDIDCHGTDIHDNLGSYIRPWLQAIIHIEKTAMVNLHPSFMVSGSKGFWIHFHLTQPVTKEAAAEFAVILAALVARGERQEGHGVHVATPVLNLLGQGREWEQSHIFSVDETTFCLDGGNLLQKNCRLPFARHQKTGRFSQFVEPLTGEPFPNQIQRLFEIGRSEADIAATVIRMRQALPEQDPSVLDILTAKDNSNSNDAPPDLAGEPDISREEADGEGSSDIATASDESSQTVSSEEEKEIDLLFKVTESDALEKN
jgi:hypothetical protein